MKDSAGTPVITSIMQHTNSYNWNNRVIETAPSTQHNGSMAGLINAFKKALGLSVSSRGYSLRK